MNVGDLVTGADAPEGAPSFLGVVKKIVISTYHHPYIETKALGDAQEDGLFRYDNPQDLRPITDLEAVGLAGALTTDGWQMRWVLTGVTQRDAFMLGLHTHLAESCLGTRGVDPIICFASEMRWQTVRQDHDVAVTEGNCEGLADGMNKASRALLRWMCSP